jgi:hypothetical protein
MDEYNNDFMRRVWADSYLRLLGMKENGAVLTPEQEGILLRCQDAGAIIRDVAAERFFELRARGINGLLTKEEKSERGLYERVVGRRRIVGASEFGGTTISMPSNGSRVNPEQI